MAQQFLSIVESFVEGVSLSHDIERLGLLIKEAHEILLVKFPKLYYFFYCSSSSARAKPTIKVLDMKNSHQESNSFDDEYDEKPEMFGHPYKELKDYFRRYPIECRL